MVDRVKCVLGFGEEICGHLEDLGVDDIIILKWTFKKWYGKSWIRLLSLRIGTVGGRL